MREGGGTTDGSGYVSDRIEFYLEGKQQPFLSLDSSFAPTEGDLINIEKVTYEVLGRSFTVDQAADIRLRSIRCNVIVKKQKR
jgi:hypothetical protein